jgi:hypothetical protein
VADDARLPCVHEVLATAAGGWCLAYAASRAVVLGSSCVVRYGTAGTLLLQVVTGTGWRMMCHMRLHISAGGCSVRVVHITCGTAVGKASSERSQQLQVAAGQMREVWQLATHCVGRNDAPLPDEANHLKVVDCLWVGCITFP